MSNANSILKKAQENGLITVKEWNEGIFTYIIYRIVWETKSHYVVRAVNSEETAIKIVGEHKDGSYFYEKVRIN